MAVTARAIHLTATSGRIMEDELVQAQGDYCVKPNGSSPNFKIEIGIYLWYNLLEVRKMKIRSDKIKSLFALLVCFMLMPITASANMVWPSLYISEGLRSWYIILCGLIIEFLFIKYFAKQTWLKSLLISFVMNTISTVVGIILIPVSGILGEFMLFPFGEGTFALSHWILSYILAVFSNVLIEGLSIKCIFKIKKMFWWLLLANAISVIICIFVHGFTLDNL